MVIRERIIDPVFGDYEKLKPGTIFKWVTDLRNDRDEYINIKIDDARYMLIHEDGISIQDYIGMNRVIVLEVVNLEYRKR